MVEENTPVNAICTVNAKCEVESFKLGPKMVELGKWHNHEPDPEAFFGSSGSFFSASGDFGSLGESGSKLLCCPVNLCHVDLRKPSSLWSDSLFDGFLALDLLSVDDVSLNNC